MIGDEAVIKGINLPPVEFNVRLRGGSGDRGELVVFDTTNTDPDVSNNHDGDPASGLYNVITAANADFAALQGTPRFWGILSQDVAEDATGPCIVQGRVPYALVMETGDADDALATHTWLTVNEAAGVGRLEGGGVGVGDRILAFNPAAIALASTLGAGEVWFDGARGFGFNGGT